MVRLPHQAANRGTSHSWDLLQSSPGKPDLKSARKFSHRLIPISGLRTFRPWIWEEIMTFDKVTERLKFGHKEYPNIYMEEVCSVRDDGGVPGQLQVCHGTLAKVDAMSISLMEELFSSNIIVPVSVSSMV